MAGDTDGNVFGECLDLVGVDKWAAAWLLRRIIFYSRAKSMPERGGKKWVALSHEWWQKDTRLSQRQLDSAFRHLREKGFIETEKHHRNGRVTAFVRVLPVVRAAISVEFGEAYDNLQVGICDHPQVVTYDYPQVGMLYSKAIAKAEAKATSSVLVEDYQKGSAGAGSHVSEEDTMKAEEPFSAADVLSGKALPKPKAKKANTTGLAATWEELYAKHFDGKAMLTITERNMFSVAVKKIGEESLDLIRWVVPNWNEFGEQAVVEAGLKTYPAVPKVKFLIAHLACAINCARKAKQPKAHKSVKPKLHAMSPAKKKMPLAQQDQIDYTDIANPLLD